MSVTPTQWLAKESHGVLYTEVLLEYSDYSHHSRTLTEYLTKYFGHVRNYWYVKVTNGPVFEDTGRLNTYVTNFITMSDSCNLHLLEIEQYRKNITASRATDITQKSQWLIDELHHNIPVAHSHENIQEESIQVISKPSEGMQEGTLVYVRKTNYATMAYILPYLLFDYSLQSPYFSRDAKGSPSSGALAAHYQYESDDSNPHKKKVGVSLDEGLDVFFQAASTCAFAIPDAGVFVSAGLSVIWGFFKPRPEMADVVDTVLTQLENDIQKDLKKLSIDTLVSDSNAYWKSRFEWLMTVFTDIQSDSTANQMPDQSYIEDTIKTLQTYCTANPGDNYAVTMERLLEDENWEYTYTNYISGAAIEILCWRTMIALRTMFDVKANELHDIKKTFIQKIELYCKNISNLLIKVHANDLKKIAIHKHGDEICIRDYSDVDENGKVMKIYSDNDMPGIMYEMWNRKSSGYLESWFSKKDKMMKTLDKWKITQTIFASEVSILVPPEDTIEVDPSFWAQKTPTEGRWQKGNSYRYGVSFVNKHFASDIVWWNTGYVDVGGYSFPTIDHIPIDLYNGASSRKLWRQFKYDDMDTKDPGTREVVKTLKNNSTTRWKDTQL